MYINTQTMTASMTTVYSLIKIHCQYDDRLGVGIGVMMIHSSVDGTVRYRCNDDTQLSRWHCEASV